ncbi:hypothetical protein AQUCO_00900818v1 [Aquilegia coerulea]|uniref:Glycosyltransferase n=1 Tax=Aquilegia coerulea TaxID=218851 RepID=A0A2G5EFI1_AQUCA|nr:hypothetical protein AQUCO_00900818v1 [Aquilegia coerulea]
MEHKPIPHVLIFPFPAQGHINSMLKLAELLCLSGLHVTFLNTEFIHLRLHRFADVETRFGIFPGFRFETISDGLPADHSRSFNSISDLIHSVKTFIEPTFRKLLIPDRLKSEDRPPVTCIIADGVLSFTIDVAEAIEVPCILWRTPSACYFWSTFFISEMIAAGELPFNDDEMDKAITSVPGMENFLRSRDLPSFCRAKELNDPGLQLILTETINSTRATAHILNTFEDLEGPILSQLRAYIPKLYTLGPLHALLNSRRKIASQPPTSSNSLLEIDRSCMTWLDQQPSKSVVYFSFGSVVFMSHAQMIEFWYGLVNSGKRFLWVLRPDSIPVKTSDFQVPEELKLATKERGYIVDWSPQEEVLVHPAVGGFFTHSGWNSTLESMVAGLPMVCWPQFADQPINSRYVSEVWKIGFDMKDTCDRSIVAKLIRDMMDDKREELVVSVNRIAEQASKCVSEGGTSNRNLDLLIEDIKAMS